MRLNGLNAMVCGSTQGIGKATAVQMASEGAAITLVARNQQALETVKEQLNTGAGQKHQVLVADFNHPDTLQQMLMQHIEQKNRYHILVNNTGGPPAGSLADATLQQLLNAFTMHLLCNHILMQQLLPAMQQQNFGRIINIISTSVKQPIPGIGVSNTIRGAVSSWAKTLSFELAPFGITVNNVLPGATKTQRHYSLIASKAEKAGKTESEIETELLKEIPAKRFGEPEEVAEAVTFLASPSAAYINGQSIAVDGGRTRCL